MSAPPTAAVAGPAPHPGTEEERKKKFLEELEQIPLFMTQLPEDGENAAVDALKTMVADEPPNEIATNLKYEGNLSFKARKFDNAARYYTKALSYKPDDTALLVALHINRAAANLELQNYGSVLTDCTEALRLKSDTPKALFRAAKACVALGKLVEADECCKWGLGMDATNKEFLNVQEEIKAACRREEKRIKEREEREQKKATRRNLLKRAVEIRSKLTFDTTGRKNTQDELHPWENGSSREVVLDEDTGHLQWPVFFLYPEAKETDFVEKFDEANTLREMLQEVLAVAPHWDDRSHPKYTVDNVDTYFLHRPIAGFDEDERLVKVSMDMRLASVLDHDKYVIREGTPSFVVLPRGDKFTEGFIDRYRKLRQQQEVLKTRK